MTKKLRLKLEALEVKSFVTQLEATRQKTVNAGADVDAEDSTNIYECSAQICTVVVVTTPDAPPIYSNRPGIQCEDGG